MNENKEKHRRSKFKRKTAWCKNRGYIKTWKFHFKYESSNTKKKIKSGKD